jgi:hypothetical protein
MRLWFSMARWDPPAEIGNSEHIGRRLFDEPMLVGTADQPSFAGLKLTHFEETRGNEWSLDRLGKSGIDRKVVAYLRPRAEAAGRMFRKPKSFDGWAVLPVRELTKARKPAALPVIASPIQDQAPKDNIYHAHTLKPQHMEAAYMALHLRHLFTTFGTVEKIQTEQSSWLSYLLSIAKGLFGHKV